jgi:hypothetical protein
MIWFLVLSAVTTAAAWALSRRHREHLPVAWFLTLAFTADAARWPMQSVLTAERAPFTGALRVLFHADEGLFLAWHAGVVALALWVFLKRRPWLVGVAWLLMVAWLSATYPVTRGQVLLRAYLAAELATLGATAGCYVMWWWRKNTPTLQTWCALIIGGVEIVIIAGPYSAGLFAAWDIAQAAAATLYVVLLFVQGGALWGLSKQSS